MRALALATAAVGVHAALLAWMSRADVVSTLLSRGADAPLPEVLGAAAFLVVRLGVVTLVPGLVAGALAWRLLRAPRP